LVQGVQEAAEARVQAWVTMTDMDVEQSVTMVKPADGAAAIGVDAHRGLPATLKAARELLTSCDTLAGEVVIEPKVLGAIEFSVSVVQTRAGTFALLPTAPTIVDFRRDVCVAERDLAARRHEVATGQRKVMQEFFDDEDTFNVMSARLKRVPTDELREVTPAPLPAAAVQARFLSVLAVIAQR
jgi:hypothetical protein